MLEHFFVELDNSKHNTHAAIIANDEQISYAQLIEKMNIISANLLSNKFSEGLSVILLPNNITTCLIILGCLRTKSLFVSIDVSAPKNEIKKILTQLKPTRIVTEDHAWIKSELGLPVYKPNDLLEVSKTSEPFITLYPDKEESFVTLTSGSTGVIKGVVHTNYSLCEAITHVLKALQLSHQHRLLCTLSHPSNAFLRNMLACLIVKATFILAHNQSIDVLLKLISLQKPTHIRFTIKDLIQFSKQQDFFKDEPSTVIRCDYSGDVIPPEVIDNVNKIIYPGKLVTSYAMSECGTIAINTWTNDDALKNLTGKILDNIKFRILNDNDMPVTDEEYGELQIQTPTLFKEYLHDPTETKRCFTDDGWFKTGDFFSMTTNGLLKFYGRKKNIIIRDGKNINPEYIRKIIIENNEVTECAIISRPSIATIAEPIAFCTVKNDELVIEQFKNYIILHLNKLWRPAHVYIVKDLPRTVFGKLDLNHIRNNMKLLIDQSILQVAFSD